MPGTMVLARTCCRRVCNFPARSAGLAASAAPAAAAATAAFSTSSSSSSRPHYHQKRQQQQQQQQQQQHSSPSTSFSTLAPPYTTSSSSSSSSSSSFSSSSGAPFSIRIGALATASAAAVPARGFAKKAAKKQQPAKIKASGDSEKGEDLSTISDMGILLDIVNSPRRQRPQLSEEEAAKNFELGRRYNQETSRRHNRENWKLQMQLDLKNAAMEALSEVSEEQRDWAEELTMEDCAFPLDFRDPTLTPPIKDFDPDKYITEDD